MLIAAAVCPHPPLLVPEVAQGAAAELDSVRAACSRAVGALLAAGPDRLVVVGAGERTQMHGPRAAGSLAAYGVPLTVGAGEPELPLSLTVGRWLAERHGASPDAYAEVGRHARAEECLVFGAGLAQEAPRVAALVMGDGSARRTEDSPGGFHPRAVEYDTAVAAALGGADTRALSALDPIAAAELTAAGRPAWQALAGAADGTGLTGDLLAHQAPYGVGYFVAVWS